MKTIQWLTAIVSTLAIIASAGGLVIQNLYRDSDLIQTAWLGNDTVTLILVPALPVTYYYYRRGEERAQLIWLGMMLYMFYNYAFYLFGTSFNWFFLIYVALFTLSLYALLLGLFQVDAKAINDRLAQQPPRKLISIFLILIAIPLGVVEIGQCVAFIFSGREPEIPTLIFALDLSFVIPNTILAAILLWRGDAWGIVLAAMMLVKSFTYGLVLVVGTVLIGQSGVGKWDPLLPFFFFVTLGGLAFGWQLVKCIKPHNSF